MKKVSCFDLAWYFLLFFPLTTLFQDKIDAINKITFFIVCSLIVFYMLRKGTVKKNNLNIVLWIIFIGNYLWVLSKGIATNINMLFYFPFLFIYTIFVLDTQELIIKFLKEKKQYLLGIVRIWTVLIAISIPMASSYVQEWGEGVYFVSYTSSAFRLCPTALFIMTLVVWLSVNEKTKKYLFYDIIPLFCMFMGGSRTYLGVGILVFLINWYLVLKNKQFFYYSLIPLMLLFCIMIQYSSMQSKLDATAYSTESYFDFWGTLTNGRSIFWSSMLAAFHDSNLMTKLLGGGFSFTVRLEGLWAHNDFIEILCSQGYTGVVIYLYVMIKQIKNLLIKSHCKIPFVLIILVILVWAVNAFFNMFYVYFCAMASYPILLLSISQYYCKKTEEIC